MENGAHGANGVPAGMKREKEQEDVTAPHLAMVVNTVLVMTFQLRRSLVSQLIDAILFGIVTRRVRNVMGGCWAPVSVKMGSV